MNWSELLDVTQLCDIEVTIINPVRKGEWFKSGSFGGFKAGVFGHGWSKDKKSFSSANIRWIKKPKVLVCYSVVNFYPSNGGQITDWIDADNCIFTFKLATNENEPEKKPGSHEEYYKNNSC